MLVCQSAAPRSMHEAAALLQSHRGLLELRTDAIRGLDLERLLRIRTRGLIITNRTAGEGGSSRGEEAEQFELLSTAVRMGAEYVDVEWRWGAGFFRRLGAIASPSRRILSHHDTRRTPPLTALYERMRTVRPEVIKIAVMARDITDTAPMIELWRRARRQRQPLIGISMGERGEITRLLGGREGCFLTYGAADPGSLTAPGQRTVDDLQKVFRVHTLDRKTRVFGLIGNPVSHSRGIYVHNEAFRRRRINAVYVNCLVDQISPFFHSVAGEFSGFSVTMPHKQSVIPELDRVDDAARTLGAVNTIVRRRGRWMGTNTDFPAVRSLLEAAGGIRGRHAVVLGSGAMARTMAVAAMREGAIVTLAGRTAAHVRSLAGTVGCAWTRLDEVESLPCDILLNATPVGMRGEHLPISRAYLRRCTLVVDAVYTPELTPLLRDAQRSGCRIITGREIFRAQARLQTRMFIDACP